MLPASPDGSVERNPAPCGKFVRKVHRHVRACGRVVTDCGSGSVGRTGLGLGGRPRLGSGVVGLGGRLGLGARPRRRDSSHLGVLAPRLPRRRPLPRRALRPPSPRAPPRAAARRPRARRASRTSTSTSVKSSIGTVWRPIRLMLSIPTLRRSTRIFCCCQISSTMSVGVTEPKSAPVGPALTSKRSSVWSERVGDLARLLEGSAPRAGARCSSRLRSSATLAGVASSASRRGSRKFRA